MKQAFPKSAPNGQQGKISDVGGMIFGLGANLGPLELAGDRHLQPRANFHYGFDAPGLLARGEALVFLGAEVTGDVEANGAGKIAFPAPVGANDSDYCSCQIN